MDIKKIIDDHNEKIKDIKNTIDVLMKAYNNEVNPKKKKEKYEEMQQKMTQIEMVRKQIAAIIRKKSS